MPGISGLEALLEIKKAHPSLPVIMITKSEEEDIMEQAIGQKIADYLIKPVNPNQIIMSIKKVLKSSEIISQKTSSNYQMEFMRLSSQINDSMDAESWKQVYNHLIFWEMELQQSGNTMSDMLQMQKTEANNLFARFIRKNYENWWKNEDKRPTMSPDLFKKKVFPLLDEGKKVFFVLIDNLRQDHWRVMQSELASLFTFDCDETFYSILPTATQYSRNAIFSGLMP